ncbi:STAS domain-containing protein [Actinoplanes sp. NPDC026670]|uniref:STAS domain-containing protein n=1 Tax=Actinoplanes sp. NPDC026670 TaxID=3154700 RepID=UPI0033EA2E78
MGVSAVRFPVGTAVARADIPALCARLADLLRGHAGDVVECDVTGLASPDVVAVEAVARLRLTARRHGRRLIVVGAGPELLLLFGLLGLTDLLAPDSPAAGCSRPAKPQPAVAHDGNPPPKTDLNDG